MDRSQHTEKPIGANQDRSSWPVAPEVLRTSGGADVPAIFALCPPLRQIHLSFVKNPTAIWLLAVILLVFGDGYGHKSPRLSNHAPLLAGPLGTTPAEVPSKSGCVPYVRFFL